jgi:hypothetical protein
MTTSPCLWTPRVVLVRRALGHPRGQCRIEAPGVDGVALANCVCDALKIAPTVIAYDDTARLGHREAVASLDYRPVYGANVHHALLLAKEMLVASERERRLLFVAYAQASAHRLPNGDMYFCYPPNPETTGARSARCGSALAWRFVQTSCS